MLFFYFVLERGLKRARNSTKRIEQEAGYMILIPFYRFLVLGKASPIFSCKEVGCRSNVQLISP